MAGHLTSIHLKACVWFFDANPVSLVLYWQLMLLHVSIKPWLNDHFSANKSPWTRDVWFKKDDTMPNVGDLYQPMWAYVSQQISFSETATPCECECVHLILKFSKRCASWVCLSCKGCKALISTSVVSEKYMVVRTSLFIGPQAISEHVSTSKNHIKTAAYLTEQVLHQRLSKWLVM